MWQILADMYHINKQHQYKQKQKIKLLLTGMIKWQDRHKSKAFRPLSEGAASVEDLPTVPLTGFTISKSDVSQKTPSVSADPYCKSNVT